MIEFKARRYLFSCDELKKFVEWIDEAVEKRKSSDSHYGHFIGPFDTKKEAIEAYCSYVSNSTTGCQLIQIKEIINN